jgi:hypothetical protein
MKNAQILSNVNCSLGHFHLTTYLLARLAHAGNNPKPKFLFTSMNYEIMRLIRERGELLTAWLVLILVANLGVVVLYLALSFSPVGRSLLLPRVALWIVYLFTALGAWNVGCTCFLFLWKKWAFFGLCASAAVVLALNLYLGVGVFAFTGLGAVIATYFILRPKWDLLENF